MQSPHPIFQNRQDKYPPTRIPLPSNQPETAPPPAETKPKHHGSEKRKTEQVAGRVLTPIKTELLRIAKQRDWTESHAVAIAVEKFIAQDTGEQFGVMIKNTIQESERSELRFFFNRFLSLIARIAYQGAQSLFLQKRILSILLGADEKRLHAIEIESEISARVNIIRRTPQDEEVKERLREDIEKDGREISRP